MQFTFIPRSEFIRIKKANLKIAEKLPLIAKMCRLNTLVEVKKAGSGHLGSSFSAMDIVVYLYYAYLNVVKSGIKNPDRDIYFSSKGHDVPGLYAVLYSLGIVPEEKFLHLRRFGGLDGHPDINIPGIEANSGSLGMGISKGRGILFSKQYQKMQGNVIILTGDGEWQEGQNYEALQSTVQQRMNQLIVIMDHNKLQSDRFVKKIVDLGNLEKKYASFGWHVIRIDGHDFSQIREALKTCEKITNKPKIIIADTIKGRGISFMEHPTALKAGGGFYKWHAGAPDDSSFQKGYTELATSIQSDYKTHGLGTIIFKKAIVEKKKPSGVSDELVSVAYGQSLYNIAKKNKKFILLDADLSADCKIKDFERDFPKRFIECGIAEQDMTSMAAGIALHGLIPVVNSFANFLAARANEQVYNAQTENKKIIYACHYAGLIPAGPGKSHQSIRDISLFGALPNCTILQAANSHEMQQIVGYAINKAKESCMLRINIGPSPSIISLPKKYKLTYGQGIALTPGKKNVLLAYGPVMLHEALIAQQILEQKKIKLKVINMPWLNRFDPSWIRKELSPAENIFVLEDHSPTGGLGDHLLAFLNNRHQLGDRRYTIFGVKGFPACGTPLEALRHHGLDGMSLAKRVNKIISNR